MSSSTPSPVNTDGDGFVQQNASAWIVFDPAQIGGHRRDVRSAAAKSSASARKATIARKLALNADCTNGADNKRHSLPKAGATSKKRRKAQQCSPTATASPTALSTRTQSETSLPSMASHSALNSRSGSPCLSTSRKSSVVLSPDSPLTAEAWSAPPPPPPPPPPPQNFDISQQEAWQAAAFVLALDSSFTKDDRSPGPTQFGASRTRTMTINSIHSALSAGQASIGTLLSVALLAAWGKRFGDERYCLMHVRAWYALARRRNILPSHSKPDAPNLSIPQIVLLSLQSFFKLSNVIDDTSASACFAQACAVSQTPSGHQIVRFFSLLGELISNSSDNP